MECIVKVRKRLVNLTTLEQSLQKRKAIYCDKQSSNNVDVSA